MPVQKTPDREYILFAMRIMGDFGVSIAAPVVIFVLIGQYLDDKYRRSPWFTIAGFVLAAALSGIMIYRKAKKYGQEYERLNRR